jgi:hypothetical protein
MRRNLKGALLVVGDLDEKRVAQMLDQKGLSTKKRPVARTGWLPGGR